MRSLEARAAFRRLVGFTATLVAATAALPAASFSDDLAERCRGLPDHEAVCHVLDASAKALERPGVSVADLREDDVAEIAIDDFYFAPRVAVVRPRQTVRFTNVVLPGGNRHAIASADWGSSRAVLPVPLLSFGGGRAFRSGRLDPTQTFELVVDLSTLDPAASVPLPGGDVLIGYFCWIHGASQMNGELLVRRAQASGPARATDAAA